MINYKEICEFEFCKRNQECMFKKATLDLRGNAYLVKLGQEESASNLFCYQKEELKPDIKVTDIKRVEDSNDSWDFELKLRENKRKISRANCQNTKCKSSADSKFNGVINLCYKCIDTLREWKTNYELGTIFKTKDKILTLFKVIEELTPKKEPNRDMVRCSNIYCGTLDKMTRHHLIPKNFRFKQTVEKIPLCEDCHKKVHQIATNQELAEKYYTKQSVIELLANDITFRKERILNAYESVMAVA